MQIHECIMRHDTGLPLCVPILSVSATLSQLPTQMEVFSKWFSEQLFMTNNAISAGQTMGKLLISRVYGVL